jgi:hypothetical protein
MELSSQVSLTERDSTVPAIATIRDIFAKFVVTVPVEKPETENLLRILISMFEFPRHLIDEFAKKRSEISKPPTKKKGGIFKIFGKKEPNV